MRLGITLAGTPKTMFYGGGSSFIAPSIPPRGRPPGTYIGSHGQVICSTYQQGQKIGQRGKFADWKNMPSTRMLCSQCHNVNEKVGELKLEYVSLPRKVDLTQVAFVISNFEAEDLLNVKKLAPKQDEEEMQIKGSFSVDLGTRSLTELYVTSNGIKLGGSSTLREVVTWVELKKMSKKGRIGAFEVYSDGETEPKRICAESEETGLVSSLMPVHRNMAPTLVLSGFTMHRVSKGVDPMADTEAKLGAILPRLRGRVLDICTGLGYTALGAARQTAVSHVMTIERDSMVHDMIERNPWSRELVEQVHAGRVSLVKGDAEEVLSELKDEMFDAVVHDPPTRSLGGGLYGAEFYGQVFRVTRSGGAVFHYIGDPTSKESGRLFNGVMERLRAVGFEEICVEEEAFGVRAVKAGPGGRNALLG